MENESRVPEWDQCGEGETAKALRLSVNGQVKFSRIPIQRRQLKCEIANFLKWIKRLKDFEVELIAKQEAEGKPYTPFFVGQTSMLIIARDRDEIGTTRRDKQDNRTYPRPTHKIRRVDANPIT